MTCIGSNAFDKESKGFLLSEGSGVLLMEIEEHAKARGAKMYCEVAGVGMAQGVEMDEEVIVDVAIYDRSSP